MVARAMAAKVGAEEAVPLGLKRRVLKPALQIALLTTATALHASKKVLAQTILELPVDLALAMDQTEEMDPLGAALSLAEAMAEKVDISSSSPDLAEQRFIEMQSICVFRHFHFVNRMQMEYLNRAKSSK
jgi:hypothetical protein